MVESLLFFTYIFLISIILHILYSRASKIRVKEELKYSQKFLLTTIDNLNNHCNMGYITPPPTSGDIKTGVKVNKTLLSDALQAKTKQLINGENGLITVAQAMAERLVNIAVFAESNTDAIAAQKLIYDRLQGKAVAVKDDETKPMPKVVFSLTQDGLDKVNESRDKEIKEFADIEDDGSGLVIAEMDNKIFVG